MLRKGDIVTERKDDIILRGLRENNLKQIDLNIPKEKIVVFTGLSGSGKSSIVFDTIAMESKRQMMLNYPHYIRNQMPRYERPLATLMQHLTQVIVVEQKPVQSHSRSTVGTYMDVQPLIRLLFSRIGTPPVHSATDFLPQSAFGKCPNCHGYGEVINPDVHKLIDFDKSLRDYAIQFKPLSPSGWQGRWMITGGLFDPNLPIKDLPKEQYDLLIYGPPKGDKVYAPFHTKNGPQDHEWDGLLPRFRRLYINRDISTLKQVSEEDVLNVSKLSPCFTCEGSGLAPDVLACKINGLNIVAYNQLELTDLKMELRKITDSLGTSLVTQIKPHIERLIDMGLGYLSIGRTMNTLSGGEAQRVKIAHHLGSSLNNVTYIFDEPTAGLHPEEINQFIHILKELRNQHNSVLVIEHDESVIQIADEVIEIGPGAGVHGGEVIYQGTVEHFKNTMSSTTLLNKLTLNDAPRKINNYFTMKEVNNNNLKNITVKVPANVLVSVCGVSGSGKSSLMLEAFKEEYPNAIVVGQGSIGISSRSTLATYMGIMDRVRSIFAKKTKQPAGLFSFNSLGKCPVCKGKGVITPDVAFADPITTTCESCEGTKYSQEALSYTFSGKNIVEILRLTIEEAIDFFQDDTITKKIMTLQDVGLGYLTFGQTTSSLSGGELQRLKLASYLQEEGQIYVLDEPSLGLHGQDNARLLNVFQRIVDKGNSVILIEHNLHFIRASDWIIELGPGSGKLGGTVVFEGTPKDMAQANTLTAKWLRLRMDE